MQRKSNPHPHLDGALALIRLRGPDTFTEPVSRSLLFYIRGLLVSYLSRSRRNDLIFQVDEALRSTSSIADDVRQWGELLPESEQIPPVRLDSINLDLANLRAATYNLSRSSPSEDQFHIDHLLAQASDIDRRLAQWPDGIPDIWLPTRITTAEGITPTLQLYQDYCDVYKTMFVASLWNKLRLSQIETRLAVLTLLDYLPPSQLNTTKQYRCLHGIQQIADDICASVPYYIGDRMRPGRAGEPGIHYPCVPGRRPIMDHYQTGPALGGWALIMPLSSLLKLRVQLRQGQKEWIQGQVARTARIYNLNLAAAKRR